MLVRGCAQGSSRSIVTWWILSMSSTRPFSGGDRAAIESMRALERQLQYRQWEACITRRSFLPLGGAVCIRRALAEQISSSEDEHPASMKTKLAHFKYRLWYRHFTFPGP